MYGRLLTLLVVVTVVLVAMTFVLNWVWLKAFGPGVPGQAQHQASQAQDDAEALKQKRVEERKAAEAERERKYKEDLKSGKIHGYQPKELAISEYDPKTGKVNWPELLLDARYDADRQKVEELLAAHAAESASEIPVAAHDAAQRIQEALEANFKSLPQTDYAKARLFLKSLVAMLKPAHPAKAGSGTR